MNNNRVTKDNSNETREQFCTFGAALCKSPWVRAASMAVGGGALAATSYLLSSQTFLAGTMALLILRGLYTAIEFLTMRKSGSGPTGSVVSGEFAGLATAALVTSFLSLSPLVNLRFAAQEDMDQFVKDGAEMMQRGTIGGIVASFETKPPLDPLGRKLVRGYSLERGADGLILSVGTKSTGVTRYKVDVLSADKGQQDIYLSAPDGSVRKVGSLFPSKLPAKDPK